MRPGRGLRRLERRSSVENGRGDAVGGFDLLEFEFVAPGDERPPDQLVGGDDDEDHDDKAADQGVNVAGVGGGLQIAAQAGELEVAVAHGEHLAGDEGEPAAGDGDDGVPDQADGGVGHFKLPEALPGGVAIDARGFDHLPGNALERGVEAEGQIPDLAGEDQQDDAHFDAELMAGNQSDHGQHHAGEKAEDGDGLEDVEDGDHPGFDAWDCRRRCSRSRRRR